MIEPQTSPNLMTTTALNRLSMTPAERAMGRFMRAPDHGDGGDPPADPPADPAADPNPSEPDPANPAPKDPDPADPDPAKDPADPSLMNSDKKDGDPDPATLPPEKYTLVAPEGFEVDDTLLAEVDPVFRELGLNDDQANKLMPLAGKFADRLMAAQQDAFQAQASDWAKEAQADAEIGGKHWGETESLVAKALDRFAGPKEVGGKPNVFRALLDETKLGNHPEMIRMFRRIGAAVSEDGEMPRSDAGAPVKQDRLAVLYPNDVKEGAN
jgi:hypothetical protein